MNWFVFVCNLCVCTRVYVYVVCRLLGCQVTEKGCSFLATALKSNTSSHLEHLDLSYNHPGENGKKMLSDIAKDPNMKLKTLWYVKMSQYLFICLHIEQLLLLKQVFFFFLRIILWRKQGEREGNGLQYRPLSGIEPGPLCGMGCSKALQKCCFTNA